MDRMSEEQVLLLFKKLEKLPEGVDLLSYLRQLSKDNYNSFKKSDSNMNDIHKGYALCVDSIIRLFENCSRKQSKQQEYAID